MQFEKAIENASTLFLFDLRSQHQLQDWADGAVNALDRTLIRLTQAAFVYYNAVETQAVDIRSHIRQATEILNEAKRFREDRVIYTLALRFEVDMLMHASLLSFLESPPGQERQRLFNDGDQRALSICDTLLKNLPTQFDPLPHYWYTALIPLFPPLQEQTILFYRDRVKENRLNVLAGILKQIRRELVAASGVIQAKQFIATRDVRVEPPGLLRTLFKQSLKDTLSRIENELPPAYQTVSDVTLPKDVVPSQLDTAMTTVQAAIDQAKAERDVRKYTGSLLHMGILNFLRGNHGRSIHALVHTLRASGNIGPEDKKLRMYRHEEFPDIPFMIGTSFLRQALAEDTKEELRPAYLRKGRTALMQAVALNPAYHHAYVNLNLAVILDGEGDGEPAMVLYLSQFGGNLSHINPGLFRNRALWESRQSRGEIPPGMIKWLLVARLCSGGEITEGRKMLQELKTLYVLNAHEFSAGYLEQYRTALRMNQESFIEDLKSDALHSALLFYIAHAYTYLSLSQGKEEAELKVDLDKLDQGIELNSEALYFNRQNSSALRLVETQAQLLIYLTRKSEKRWENINFNIGQRFQLFEDYLRQERTLERLRTRLGELKLENILPEIKVSQAVRLKMDGLITPDQQKRIRDRVVALTQQIS
jgi:hypothetical protein